MRADKVRSRFSLPIIQMRKQTCRRKWTFIHSSVIYWEPLGSASRCDSYRKLSRSLFSWILVLWIAVFNSKSDRVASLFELFWGFSTDFRIKTKTLILACSVYVGLPHIDYSNLMSACIPTTHPLQLKCFSFLREYVCFVLALVFIKV